MTYIIAVLGFILLSMALWDAFEMIILPRRVTHYIGLARAYFRSQHVNQSWVAALTAILDACALVIAGANGGPTRQARLTFAMARHAAVDLAQILVRPPRAPAPDRLPPSSLTALRAMLAEAGFPLQEGVAAEQRLRELRQMYEPYVQALSEYLSMALPPWFPVTVIRDNWQASAWEKFIKEMATPTHSRQYPMDTSS